MSIRKSFSRPILFIAFIPFVLWLSLFWRIFLYSFFDETKQKDTIVVLGDSIEDGHLSYAYQAQLDHAAELFKQGYAPLIILMGGTEKEKKEINSDIGAKYLREAGIADKSIIFAPYGRDMFNTIQWADYEVRQYTEDGIGSSLFVGNDYHNYRIETTARDIGMITNLSPVKSKFLFSRFYHVFIESFSYIAYLIAEVS
ncbi:MAG: hypothetical protein CO042_02060 [Parcubacteria group bacterium CG_4_9_14_0_2_um_filter_41_8]|nr:MAG: hypothetical protein AUJ34_01385 [Parcubacteria group bacterium CG1_02_41_12]PIP67409.1 MAG: hypothetical protein COW93_00275 [Parcubacteria group bacterium CG22_combo_CG10-13_8_21_14_all_41_9]PIQ78337.1 MAG: hypothetical protein COV79_05375 [Parcubacteria group bacterium CG11_big_fil_rev_8_21_14_0_20_41_14]PIR57439.1 MAG: hypothetical protein COU72_00935 [Parcubacteria group bacterium CG10_big_fil_rev_8_21_14_0_10_41_35]PJC40751.1 MAG: hypothetical protein CO042_02060 [Parcubacteria gr